MKNIGKKLLVLTAIALTASALRVDAALVTYKTANTSSSDLLAIFNLNVDGVAMVDYVGGIKLEKVGGDPSMPDKYVSLCTDIRGVLKMGKSYIYDTVTFDGQVGIDPAWGKTKSAADAAQAIQNAAYLFSKYAPATDANTSANKAAWAAIQLAVWEALYDSPGTFSLTSGRFAVTGSGTVQAQALALASTYLADLAQNTPALGTYSGYLLRPDPIFQNGATPQGLLFNPTLAPVPEPSTIIAGLFLLIPLGVRAMRRKQAIA